MAVFGCMQYLKGESLDAEVNLEEGFRFRVRPNWVLDFAVRERGLAVGPLDTRIRGGLTVNLGHL